MSWKRRFYLVSVLLTPACEASDPAGSGSGSSGLTGGQTDGTGFTSGGDTDATGPTSSGDPGTSGLPTDVGATSTTGTTGDEGELAGGIRLTQIILNQAVATELMVDGAVVAPENRTAVIIGSRPGVIQAFYDLDPSFAARPIEGRLTLQRPDGTQQVLRTERTVTAASGPYGSLESTFSWIFEAEDLPGDVQWSVGLFEVDGSGTGSANGARFPESGQAPLSADGDHIRMNVVLIPVDADCGAAFDLEGPGVQDHLRGLIYNMFPISELNLIFHEPTTGDCQSSESARRLREQEARGPSYFYQALFDEVQTDCGGGGGAFVVETEMDADRASWAGALGGPACGGGLDWTNTPHELGHNTGRQHTFDDPDYPNEGSSGERVTWGFGVSPGQVGGQDEDMLHRFFAPDEYGDIMSYWGSSWVGAYTYNGIFEVMKVVGTWGDPRKAPELEAYYTTRSIHGTFTADGLVRWSVNFGHPRRERSQLDEHNYVVFRGPDGSPGPRQPIRTKFAIDPWEAGWSSPRPAGVVIPLPHDYETAVDTFEVVVGGARYEVDLREVEDLLPRDLDWRARVYGNDGR